MNPSFSSRRAALAAGAVAVAAALLPPGAGAITAHEMVPHRRTLADVEAVGAAMSAWLSDQVSLAPGAPALGGTVDVTDYPSINHADLVLRLVPTYIPAVPVLDGWGNPYEYRLDTLSPFDQGALIRSAGADGALEGDVYEAGEFATLASDLVWADGELVRGPGPPLIDYVARQRLNPDRILHVGAAILQWVTDQVSIAPPRPAAAGGSVDLSLFTPISHAGLEALLVPGYLLYLPPADTWGEPFDFYLDTLDLLGPELTAIRSRGLGGTAEGDVYTPGTFDGGNFAGDTVWADGVLVRSADLSMLIFYDDFETGDTRFWSDSRP